MKLFINIYADIIYLIDRSDQFEETPDI